MLRDQSVNDNNGLKVGSFKVLQITARRGDIGHRGLD